MLMYHIKFAEIGENDIAFCTSTFKKRVKSARPNVYWCKKENIRFQKLKYSKRVEVTVLRFGLYVREFIYDLVSIPRAIGCLISVYHYFIRKHAF